MAFAIRFPFFVLMTHDGKEAVYTKRTDGATGMFGFTSAELAAEFIRQSKILNTFKEITNPDEAREFLLELPGIPRGWEKEDVRITFDIDELKPHAEGRSIPRSALILTDEEREEQLRREQQ